MRGFAALPALAAALAAGCGRPEADQSANAAVALPSVAEVQANAGEAPPPPSPAIGNTIPATMVGVYDSSIEACGKASDAHLAVSPTELRFHESIGRVRRVTATGADTVTVEADYQGEGESWRSLRELKLGDGGATLTVSGDGTRLVRVRCPEGAR
jgi:hypothetical protein